MSPTPGIAAVRALALPLDWGVLRLGFEGVANEGRLASLEDVRQFACDSIAAASEAQLGDVAELCTASSESPVREILERLAPAPSARALRVWRAALLDCLLQRDLASPVDVLAEMSAFWAGFGYPPDSPHLIQGRGNSISPEAYYTKERAHQALEDHRRWLSHEVASLRSMALDMD